MPRRSTSLLQQQLQQVLNAQKHRGAARKDAQGADDRRRGRRREIGVERDKRRRARTHR